MQTRWLLRVATALALALAPATAAGQAPPLELEGALHEHSGYSDGWPGSTPRDYFAAGRAEGLDFMGSSEHSDNADVPVVLSDLCAEDPSKCLNADPVDPADALRKWDATAEQAQAATREGFVAFRGFEWTSDRFGHVNVYGSTEDVNAKVDGGYADLDAFYAWLTRPAELGGGSDGVATFNHPGAKDLFHGDPGNNWDDFRHVPSVDPQMVGMEVFNDRTDYGSVGAGAKGDPPPEGWYGRALDRGWHVGAVGAEDLGHRREDDWGGPDRAKTVVLAGERTRESILAALRARRSYAIRRTGTRLRFTVDASPLGSRLERRAGAPLRVRASVTDPASDVRLDLITSGGAVVARGDETLDVQVPASQTQRYYYVRARRGGGEAGPGEPIAYSSPVWVTATADGAGPSGAWLAGDLHVHSCFSGDVFCGPADEPLDAEPGDDPEHLAAETRRYLEGPGSEAYTYGLTVGQRFAEASARGLDFTVITDHNDVRSSADPSFGSAGVIGVAGYESSIEGHAQMLGARQLYAKGDASAAAINAQARALRADGGAFQVNHPGYRAESPFATCAETGPLHWTYGYAVRPDSIELWNPTSSIGAAEAYYECWLGRGERIAATGGSDTHWAALTTAQGQGAPTTWVFARDRSEAGVLAGVREGRTSLSKTTTALGRVRLVLEADAERDGTYEATIGDEVVPGARMRVRAEGASATGYVRVRANGMTLVDDQPLAPGGTLEFDAPAQPGWVRANLLSTDAPAENAPGCEPSGQSASTCAYDAAVLAMTSPIYLRAAPVEPAPGPGPSPAPSATPTATPTATPPATPAPSPSASPQGPAQPTATPGAGASPPSPVAPSAAPGSTPPAAGGRRPRLDLRNRPLRATLRARRGVRVRVLCPARCDARVELRRGGRVLARATVTRAAVRTLRLRRATLRRLRAGERFEVRLVAGGRVLERRTVVVRR